MKILEKLFPLWAVLMVGLIIVLNSFGVFPAGMLFALLVLLAGTALAVWRPALGFRMFLAVLPLEYVPLVSVGGTDMRWYQMMGVALAIGVFLKKIFIFYHFRKGGNLGMWKSLLRGLNSRLRGNDTGKWIDGAVLAVAVSGFVSAVLGGGASMKQAVVFVSFVFLYFLVRYFVRNKKDVEDAFPYLLGSFFVSALYGIAQNILFVRGFTSLEVMPGRPNATFSEADWFGLYTALGMVTASVFVWKAMISDALASRKVLALRVMAYELFALALLALVISVSRSAWLAGLAGLVVVKLGLFFRYGVRKMWRWGIHLGIVLFVVVGAVWVFHLSTFELGNRLQSIGSGQQEITVACPGGMDVALPKYIENEKDIEGNGCIMIDLEEIDTYSAQGYAIQKIYRNDPNAQIRQKIWVQSVLEIKTHPIFGLGWGNIGVLLGVDERGASLNSSNIFLEFWLGAGVVGFLGMVFIFGYLLWKGYQGVTHDPRPTTHDEIRSLTNDSRPITHDKIREENQAEVSDVDSRFLFSLTSLGIIVALLVFNLFNSAHFLGIVWVTLALLVTLTNTNKE